MNCTFSFATNSLLIQYIVLIETNYHLALLSPTFRRTMSYQKHTNDAFLTKKHLIREEEKCKCSKLQNDFSKLQMVF